MQDTTQLLLYDWCLIVCFDGKTERWWWYFMLKLKKKYKTTKLCKRALPAPQESGIPGTPKITRTNVAMWCTLSTLSVSPSMLYKCTASLLEHRVFIVVTFSKIWFFFFVNSERVLLLNMNVSPIINFIYDGKLRMWRTDTKQPPPPRDHLFSNPHKWKATSVLGHSHLVRSKKKEK